MGRMFTNDEEPEKIENRMVFRRNDAEEAKAKFNEARASRTLASKRAGTAKVKAKAADTARQHPWRPW